MDKALFKSLVAVAAASAIADAATHLPRQNSNGTATVNLSQATGEAQYLASGFIYGFPGNGTSADNSIPDSFLTNINFNACRASGAQIEAPGWAFGGYDDIGRFNSTLSNYRSARKHGADFILLPHDLWGSDGGAGSKALYPGDDGDWAEMEAFLGQLIEDLKVNDMPGGLVVDI